MVRGHPRKTVRLQAIRVSTKSGELHIQLDDRKAWQIADTALRKGFWKIAALKLGALMANGPRRLQDDWTRFEEGDDNRATNPYADAIMSALEQVDESPVALDGPIEKVLKRVIKANLPRS